MPRGFGLAVAAGLVSAIVFLTAVSEQGLFALLCYLVALPLVMAGLCRGLASSLLAALVSLLAVAAIRSSALPEFAVIAVLPALLMVRQGLLCRRRDDGTLLWYPPGRILGWLTAAAALLLLTAALLAQSQDSGTGNGLQTLAGHYAGEQVDLLIQAMGGDFPADLREQLVSLLSAFLPGVTASQWLLLALLNGWLGQWVAGRLGQALRPPLRLDDLEPPPWVGVGVAVSLVLGLLAAGELGYLGRNLLVLLLVPYLLTGLVTVHRTLGRRPHGGMLLTAFYMAFFVLSGWSLAGVAGLGLIRHWTRLRRQEAGGGQEKK